MGNTCRRLRRKVCCERRPRFSDATALLVFTSADGMCFYCSADVAPAMHRAGRWHIDHRYPWTLGGSNEPHNLVPACVRCNLGKGDSLVAAFAKKRSLVPRCASRDSATSRYCVNRSLAAHREYCFAHTICTSNCLCGT